MILQNNIYKNFLNIKPVHKTDNPHKLSDFNFGAGRRQDMIEGGEGKSKEKGRVLSYSIW